MDRALLEIVHTIFRELLLVFIIVPTSRCIIAGFGFGGIHRGDIVHDRPEDTLAESIVPAVN